MLSVARKGRRPECTRACCRSESRDMQTVTRPQAGRRLFQGVCQCPAAGTEHGGKLLGEKVAAVPRSPLWPPAPPLWEPATHHGVWTRREGERSSWGQDTGPGPRPTSSRTLLPSTPRAQPWVSPHTGPASLCPAPPGPTLDAAEWGQALRVGALGTSPSSHSTRRGTDSHRKREMSGITPI